MLRVAFLTLYDVEAGSTRQRVHDNVRHFPDDVEVDILSGVTAASLARAAHVGGRVGGLFAFVEELGRKLAHLWRARRADVIVVQKGLTTMSVRGLPRLLFGLGKPVVFDFDDAVHLGPAQGFRAWGLRSLLHPEQVMEMLPRFAAVVAGNRFLGEVASRHNDDVTVIGTPIDIAWYQPREPASADPRAPTVIGWSGSAATNHYLGRLAPILTRVGQRVAVELRVISSDDRDIPWDAFAGVETSFVRFRLERLVDDLRGFDIGLMPLDDEPWSRFKCGGKALQYMGCGVPPVASPVGVNPELIEDGVTGFLADSDERWVDILVRLAGDAELRERVGRAARASIEERHATEVTAPRLLAVLRRAHEGAVGGTESRPGGITLTTGR